VTGRADSKSRHIRYAPEGGSKFGALASPLPPGLPRHDFIARISTVIEDATNRLVATAQQEQAQLFGGVPASPSAKAGGQRL
jgi:hypothetical protein